MSKSKMAKREFYVHNEAWYAPASKIPNGATDEIMVCVTLENGFGAEFAFRWYEPGGRGSYARLEVYDDAWRVLPACADLMAALPALAAPPPSPATIIALLKSLGFVDATDCDPKRRAELEAVQRCNHCGAAQ